MASTTSFPLLRLGRLQLDPRLRALQPGTNASDLVVTAAVPVPDAPGHLQPAWEVAWNDAVRQAAELGASPDSAQALSTGTGDAEEHGPGTRVVVAAHGQVLHEQWLGGSIGENSVAVGALPHLAAAASAAAARPACVVVVADRDGADVIAHASGGEAAVEHFLVGKREPSQSGHVREEPPAVHHGERNVTGSEPVSGGQANATEIAARIDDAAAKVEGAYCPRRGRPAHPRRGQRAPDRFAGADRADRRPPHPQRPRRPHGAGHRRRPRPDRRRRHQPDRRPDRVHGRRREPGGGPRHQGGGRAAGRAASRGAAAGSRHRPGRGPEQQLRPRRDADRAGAGRRGDRPRGAARRRAGLGRAPPGRRRGGPARPRRPAGRGARPRRCSAAVSPATDRAAARSLRN